MAAKGYLEAFRTVKKSVARVLHGENAGQVFRQDYSDWYRAMFSESVRAGLLQSYHLAGHRSAPDIAYSAASASATKNAATTSSTVAGR